VPDTIVRCAAPDTAADWELAVRAAAAEGQGYYTVAVVHEANLASVCYRAADGHREARRTIEIALPAFADQLDAHKEPSPAAPACLVCSGAFWRGHTPAAVIVLSAALDDPGHLLASGICPDCWDALGTYANRRDAILDGLRVHYLLPDLRVLPPLAAAGHA
jgi:hypothetical protein